MPDKSEINVDQLLKNQRELAESVQTIITNFKKDSNDRKNKSYCYTRLSRVEDAWSAFDTNHAKLEKSLPSGDKYFSEFVYRDMKNVCEKAISLLEAKLNSLHAEQKKDSEEIPPSADAGQFKPLMDFFSNLMKQNARDADNASMPKLPPIQISKFDGKRTEFRSFFQLFINVIDKNPKLGAVRKMEYLLGYLDGEPKRIISHLEFSEENYQHALYILQQRYDNERLVASQYATMILDHKKTEFRAAGDIISLHDTVYEAIVGLENLADVPSDMILMEILLRKLDSESLRLFEESLGNSVKMPALTTFLGFLKTRYRVLTQVQGDDKSKLQKGKPNTPNVSTPKGHKNFHATTAKSSCPSCNKPHSIFKCQKFKGLTPREKFEFAKKAKLCFVCLQQHGRNECTKDWKCRTCNLSHNSWLHLDSGKNEKKENETSSQTLHAQADESAETSETPEGAQSLTLQTGSKTTLLPTAMIRIKGKGDEWQTYKALIDSGSADTFISVKAAQNLGVPKMRVQAPVRGFGDSQAGICRHRVQLMIKPYFPSQFVFTESALVYPKLTGLLPTRELAENKPLNLENTVLADPTHDTPGQIDVILSADMYCKILQEGLRTVEGSSVKLQKTKLGWLMLGKMAARETRRGQVTSLISMAEIDDNLRAFWEMETETGEEQKFSIECEDHFQATCSRDETGRYTVAIPFKGDQDKLGDSRKQAVARLLSIERKMKKDSNLRREYTEFMAEYLRLGHMSPATSGTGRFYLPHHAVIKAESISTKTRVVFDASCKSSSGYSLNDLMHKGPRIQQNIAEILLRWRKHRVVLLADVEKMFRQIWLKKDDREFHRIVWRADENDQIQEFTLNTVTYGTAAATYLSVRCLEQLAKDEGHRHPLAAKILVRDFYVDDLITGTDTVEQARDMQAQLKDLLKLGGFNLRKWASNFEEAIVSESGGQEKSLDINKSAVIKTLGVHWDSTTDSFHYETNITFTPRVIKRQIVSHVATIYDPPGWISPITLRAKFLIQQLWKKGIGWDEEAPPEAAAAWEEFVADLPYIKQISLPRWINTLDGTPVEIHGFADASEKAFAAVVYAKITADDGTPQIFLLASKTRVVPLKGKITLPRLELCAALLLANLLKDTLEAMELNTERIFLWSDSQITLSWIRKDPVNWETYVANRVSKIQKITQITQWRHVESKSNPADIASRGMTAKDLLNCQLWWNGPEFIKEDCSSRCSLVTLPQEQSTIEEDAVIQCAARRIEEIAEVEEELLNKYSSFPRLRRVVAIMKRFIFNCRNRTDRISVNITVLELKEAEITLIKMLQGIYFKEEVSTLASNRKLRASNHLLTLAPFLDNKGVLRVGGRLRNSKLNFDAKNQILLPKNAHVTRLIIEEAHMMSLHGGIQLTLNVTRQKFWIVNGASAVRHVLRSCMKCFRYQAKGESQFMGDLPVERVVPSPVFAKTGVDFAGPFTVKASKGRGIKVTKGYVALFVCLATKAVHLELVSDLSAEAFLASFQRFIARRGRPVEMFSDQGRNFVCASKTLTAELTKVINSQKADTLCYLTELSIKWNFNPPYAPHFGGIWESGVKSVKWHLKRVLENTALTFEEFLTVLIRVECCLNSRPIAALSSDPNDFSPLSPAHFLVGRNLMAPPEEGVDVPNPGNRWRLVSKLTQDLWTRWSRDYLSNLQQRYKWKSAGRDLKPGDLVLIKEDSPPTVWPMGRITEVHPGRDGVVRVVSLRTKGNTIRQRPAVKICKLPIETPGEAEDDLSVTEDVAQDAAAGSGDDQSGDAGLTSEDDVTTTRRTRRRVGQVPMVMLGLLFLLGLALGAPTQTKFVNFTLLHLTPGLYVERLGVAHVLRGHMTVEKVFNVSSLQEDGRNVLRSYLRILDACNQLRTLTKDDSCLNLLRHLEQLRNERSTQIDEIAHTRKKRSIVSLMMNMVFGNDDTTDPMAVMYNQNTILKTMNHQTAMLSEKISQSNKIVELKLMEFDQRISEVTSALNDQMKRNQEIDKISLKLDFMIAYTAALSYYEELNSVYAKLLKAITGAATTRDILSLTEVNAARAKAVKMLDTSLEISLELKGGFHRVEDDMLILCGILEIVETASYELLHVTPVPHHDEDNTLLIPTVDGDSIGVDYNQQLYFTYNSRDSTCHTIGGSVFTCNPQTIYSMKDHPSCILEEIIQQHGMSSCNSKRVTLQGMLWKGLMQANSWLFVTDQPKGVAVICSGHREEFTAINSSILRVNDGCSVNSQGLILRATINPIVRTVETYHKAVSYENRIKKIEETPVKYVNPRPILPAEPLLHTNLTEAVSVVTLKDVARHPATTAGSFVIAIVVGIIIWMTRGRWRKACCSQPGTTPATQQPSPLVVQKLERLIEERERAVKRSEEAATAPGQDV